MSSQAITHVWNTPDVTAEEKLLLIWLANSSGGLGSPVMIDPIGMGNFIGVHFERAMEVLGALLDKNFIRWEIHSEEWSSYIWIAYPGEYLPPINWSLETKNRNTRVAALIERDGAECAYCGCTPVNYEVDHFIPRAKGGEDRMHNLVLACSPCNRAKRDKLPEEFLKDRPKLFHTISTNLKFLHE